jgi:hypothetical protein
MPSTSPSCSFVTLRGPMPFAISPPPALGPSTRVPTPAPPASPSSVVDVSPACRAPHCPLTSSPKMDGCSSASSHVADMRARNSHPRTARFFVTRKPHFGENLNIPCFRKKLFSTANHPSHQILCEQTGSIFVKLKQFHRS